LYLLGISLIIVAAMVVGSAMVTVNMDTVAPAFLQDDIAQHVSHGGLDDKNRMWLWCPPSVHIAPHGLRYHFTDECYFIKDSKKVDLYFICKSCAINANKVWIPPLNEE
jgi:hypothetical protein